MNEFLSPAPCIMDTGFHKASEQNKSKWIAKDCKKKLGKDSGQFLYVKTRGKN